MLQLWDDTIKAPTVIDEAVGEPDEPGIITKFFSLLFASRPFTFAAERHDESDVTRISLCLLLVLPIAVL